MGRIGSFRVLLSMVLVAAAIPLGGSGRQPSLSLDDIQEIRFTSNLTGTSRKASAAEIKRFVEAYSGARDLEDDFGTTPPAQIDVTLKSGASLMVYGGGEAYQTVQQGDRQFNIRSEQLHLMLQEIAADGDEERP